MIFLSTYVLINPRKTNRYKIKYKENTHYSGDKILALLFLNANVKTVKRSVNIIS